MCIKENLRAFFNHIQQFHAFSHSIKEMLEVHHILLLTLLRGGNT
jgi:hypothetical protein